MGEPELGGESMAWMGRNPRGAMRWGMLSMRRDIQEVRRGGVGKKGGYVKTI